MPPKVLISDALSPAAVQIFKDRGVEVDFQPNLGKDKDKLAEIIGNYDGLAIRSATKVTAKILEQGEKPQGDRPRRHRRRQRRHPGGDRQGHHRDEHAVRQLDHHGRARDHADARARAPDSPQADASTQAGKWEKNRFMGVEITGKTLGIIGCGNIGSIVADRAHGLQDEGDRLRSVPVAGARGRPRRREGRARRAVLRRADFITLHTPLTDKTRNIIDAKALAKTKKGVRIINCARGGLVDEAALRAALDSGHVAGAAFDVFSVEPATENPLFGHPNVVCTPHLGAATTEAQENVALQVAEQMSDYLLRGAISNAVNFPSITAEEAPKLKPVHRARREARLVRRPAHRDRHHKVQITYEGAVAQMNTKALTSAAIAGLLRPMLQDVNVVSAPIVAKERGIVVEEMTREAAGRLREPDHGDGRRPSGSRARSPAPSIRRRPAAHRQHQGHPHGRGVRPLDDLHHQSSTSRASSAGSRRRSARPASTSRPSTSAARRPAATPSR